jgi:DNA-binding LacI/PurR family transcriptional regulator
MLNSTGGVDVAKNKDTGYQPAITTTEIAARCGLSRATVSAVLNGKGNVREKNRAKVLECIREYGYEAGIVSKTMVGEFSYMIAVLASNLGSPFHMLFFRGLSEVLVGEGYHILFHNVLPEDEQDSRTVDSLHALRPAGYIVLEGAAGPNDEHIREIVKLGVPLVTQGRIAGVDAHAVIYDELTATMQATDHVIEHGHRRLGYIAGPTFSEGAQQRKMGFLKSVVAHGIPMSDVVMVDAGETADQGHRAALELLKNPDTRPSALVCFNDMCAVGVYRAAHDLSLKIPQDVSVVGFDGIEIGELISPALTTIDIRANEQGRRAAEILLGVLRNTKRRGAMIQEVEPELVVRNSVQRIGAPPQLSEQPQELVDAEQTTVNVV